MSPAQPCPRARPPGPPALAVPARPRGLPSRDSATTDDPGVPTPPGPLPAPASLEGHEPRRVGRANARAAVLDGLVADGELPQVVADHLGLDLDRVEHLAVVDAHDGADHLGHHDHVAQVGLDHIGLVVRAGALLLGLAQLLDERHRLGLEAAREPPPRAGMDELHELVHREVQEGVQVHSAEGELAEGALLGRGVGLLRHGSKGVRCGRGEGAAHSRVCAPSRRALRAGPASRSRGQDSGGQDRGDVSLKRP
mmetsp:Transcript_8294/g.28223  ORF Transcript_8294/g.28223 Transcript_8294/m.28223 type:complete len:253 (+) Transcript_8294:620-1378(+)